MRDRHRIIFIVLGLTLALVIAGGPASAVEKTSDGIIILKLAHSSPPDSPTQMASAKFSSLVKERTNGKIDIKIFPSEQLGIEKATLEGAVLGTVDLPLADAAYVADLYAPMGVFDFPYTYRDWDHFQTVLRGPILGELSDLVEKEVGIKILGQWIYGRRILASSKPVFSPADAKTLKIRTPPSELAMENARVLGGIPTPIAFAEVYMALKQGVADAMENPSTNIYDAKIYEATKYLILTEHVWNNEILSMSKKALQALTPEQQKIIFDAAKEAAEYRMVIQKELENKRIDDLRKVGMHVIIPSSLEPFRKIAVEIEKKYRDKYAKVKWGEWHDRVIKSGQ